MPDKFKAESDWWKEDANRYNKMAEVATKSGVVVKTGGDLKPPKLNEDGSLKEE